MKGKGTWILFVRNRIKAIYDSDISKWDYVPTRENQSNLESTETEKMPKKEKQVLAKEGRNGKEGILSNLLEKYPLWKTIRLTVLVMRFIANCHEGKKKRSVLSTEEIESVGCLLDID